METTETQRHRDTEPLLSCRRCDYQLQPGQHDIFLVKHLHDAHGLTVHDGAAELRVIREEFNAGNSPAARIAALEAENAKLRVAVEKALVFHNRYCDRVGAADGWARAVHEALRAALTAD